MHKYNNIITTMQLTALLIDDSVPDATLMKSLLYRTGFRVDYAESSSHGINLLNENKYHLILVDLILPDINGFDLLQTIRSTDQGSIAMLIAYTGLDQKKNYEEALQHGADDIFVKSPEKITLLESRLRGIANKLKRDVLINDRLTSVENSIDQIKFNIDKIVANTEPVKDLSDAWNTTRSFLEIIAKIGMAVQKTKWLWGPIIALGAWFLTGGSEWINSKK